MFNLQTNINIGEAVQGLLGSFSDSLPSVVGALLVLFIGYIVAKAIKKLVYRILKSTKWDEKLLGSNVGTMDMNSFIAKLVYFLIMIMVLMIVLDMLGVQQVLDPLKDMVSKFFGYIPNIIGAGIIAFIGYILATVASEAVGMGGDLLGKLSSKIGFETEQVAKILKSFVFLFIILLFAVPALDTLDIDAISEPAKRILDKVMITLPNILVAGAIIWVFVWAAGFISKMMGDIFRNMNLNAIGTKLGLDNMVGTTGLSGILQKTIYFFIAFFGVVTGVEMLGFDALTDIMNKVLEIAGSMIFGLVLLVIGNFVSKFAAKAVAGSGEFLSSIVRIATFGLFLAISLRSMGIANSIVELAFGLTLGSVAVAVALAYGLGGREAAGEHMRKILGKF